jgi:hypothetical protein
MGASGWEYYVPYQVDVTAALRDLQAQVFERGEIVWHGEWKPGRSLIPATLDELWQDQWAQTEGTHSILDVDRVIDPHDYTGDMMTVRPLTDDEVQTCIGSDKPTRADFERAYQDGGLVELIAERWNGCCTVLFADDGEPTEIVFWGISGD